MKKIVVLFACMLVSFSYTHAQLKLDPKDFDHLVTISELYSSKGPDYPGSLEAHRTPLFNHLIDALQATEKKDKAILDPSFLSRPANDELVLWYVVREIHYNRTNDSITPRPDTMVAREILEKNIDERWLLDNYYYRIFSVLGYYFNKANMSKLNFNTEELGLKNETEKAIFYLNMMDALVGGRFKVLQMMKNNKNILEFAGKLPTFNNKPYYYYTAFNYPDFDWMGYDKMETYNSRHIKNLFGILIAHLNAIGEKEDKKMFQDIYFNSVLHQPDYFKYTGIEDNMNALYLQMN